MIRLYYIIQLAFRKKDYLSRSDLINEPRSQRQRQSEIQIMSRIPCTISVLKLEGATEQGIWMPHGDEIRPGWQPARKWGLSPTYVRDPQLPTVAMSLHVNFLGPP